MNKKVFLDILLKQIFENTAKLYSLEELEIQGVVEDRDLMDMEDSLEKKDVARILHQVLLQIIDEEDDKDWEAAFSLKDIYDCHVCVRHISQMYVKGIIEADDKQCFGNDTIVTKEMALCYFERLFNLQDRLTVNGIEAQYIKISLEDVNEIKRTHNAVKLVDVRYENDEPFLGYQKFSLNKILQNPYCITDDKNAAIVLRCQKGYLASLAANVLLDYGYKCIYVVG